LSVPLAFVIVRGSSIISMSVPLISSKTLVILYSSSTLPIAPSIISTHLKAVYSLLIAGFKKKQKKYKVALCI
jgi:hypothetical protein